MGREIKRVATDFQWPLSKVWKGYINPHYDHSYICDKCDGSFYSETAQHYHDQWYGKAAFDPIAHGSKLITPETPALRRFVEFQVDRSIREAEAGRTLNYYTDDGRLTREQAIKKECNRLLNIFNEQWCHHLNEEDVQVLINADRLWDFTRRPLPGVPLEEYIRTRAYYLWEEAGRPEGEGKEFWEKAAEEHSGGWLPFSNGYVPTPEEVNGWSISGFGHYSSNAYLCVKARCEKEGKPFLCDVCDVCNGNRRIWSPPEAEQWAKDWEKEEPPAGEGYQIWETVSEGSPISPVFSDPKILAKWMANSPPWGADQGTTAEQWLKFILGPGWAPSGVIVNGEYKSGVQALIDE